MRSTTCSTNVNHSRLWKKEGFSFLLDLNKFYFLYLFQRRLNHGKVDTPVIRTMMLMVIDLLYSQ